MTYPFKRKHCNAFRHSWLCLLISDLLMGQRSHGNTEPRLPRCFGSVRVVDERTGHSLCWAGVSLTMGQGHKMAGGSVREGFWNETVAQYGVNQNLECATDGSQKGLRQGGSDIKRIKNRCVRSLRLRSYMWAMFPRGTIDPLTLHYDVSEPTSM